MSKNLFPFLFTLLLSPFIINAQQNHFIYFQTEGKQPFYVKFENKILSSSASGYLIVPKLRDGVYSFTIGFPKAELGEQHFSCAVENKDAGYLVKNFGDKGWGLFNLQTLDVVMNEGKAKTKEQPHDEKTDAFSTMLSDVVNDPSIKQKEKSGEPVKSTVGKKVPDGDPGFVNKPEEKINGQQDDYSIKQEKKVAGHFISVSIYKKEINTDDYGTAIVYVDSLDDRLDTIRIFIPAEKKVEEPKLEPVIKNAALTNGDLKVDSSAHVDSALTLDLPVVDKKEDDKKFLPIEIVAEKKEGPEEGTIDTEPKSIVNNTGCSNYATDEDFLKLRKKMAAAATDDEMIQTARKAFKSKCFTTIQIKHLSVLFLKDEGKYQFFDLAYQHVSDVNSFNSLESELSETYYINRFRVMVIH